MLLALLLGASVVASPAPTKIPERTAEPSVAPRFAHELVGTGSWGDGWSGVVTRLPRGTVIQVCGPLACWSGRSVGYGPAKWTGRITDMSRTVFSEVCGAPSMGLCRVTLRW